MIHGARAVAIAFVLLMGSVPLGQAQSVGQLLGGVDRCTKACDPNALDGGGPRRGNESSWVVLYGHLQDAFSRIIYNTQAPDPKHEIDRSVSPNAFCADTRTGTPADLHFRGCEYTGYSSPGLVEYLNDGWRTHPEPGLASNATIVGDTITFYVTLTTKAVAPAIGVYARLETGRHVGKGDIIAESDPTASTNRRTLVGLPGDPYVFSEYEVKMAVQDHVIPAANDAAGILLTFRIIQYDDARATVTAPGWELRIGHRFPPRLVLELAPPMKTMSTSVTGYQNQLYVRWAFLSVWGSYDVADSTLSLRSTGPTSIPQGLIRHIILKRSVDFDGHFKPLNSTWSIPMDAVQADGDYELTASVSNLQGSYVLEERIRFTVEDGVAKVKNIDPVFVGEAAGAETGLLLAAVLGTAWAKRHRRRPPAERQSLSTGPA